jgi:hypothetical protein
MKPLLLATGACVVSFIVGVLAGLSTALHPRMNHVAHAYGWMALKEVGTAPPLDRRDAARRYVDMGALAADDEWSRAYKVTRLLALALLTREDALSFGDTDAIAKDCSELGWLDCSPGRLQQVTSEFVKDR